jgi:class 3 adenylate cyclase
MGIHVGAPRAVCDPMTRRVEFIGPVVNAAARITAMTHGGQVLMSHAAYRALTKGHAAASGEPALQLPAVDTSRILKLGTFEMPDAPQGTF